MGWGRGPTAASASAHLPGEAVEDEAKREQRERLGEEALPTAAKRGAAQTDGAGAQDADGSPATPSRQVARSGAGPGPQGITGTT